MPNDMSPIAPLDPTTRLALRTDQYCCRARTLADDPCLTMTTAANALDHLAALQAELASEQLRQSAPLKTELHHIEAPFKDLESALTLSRAILSEALLHAKPDTPNLYGPVPHGVQPDAAINLEKDTTPATAHPPQPISASRALLDLEALRPYLSDSALTQAIENYSKDRRAHDVQGVAYADLPPSAHFPCTVY